MMIFFQLFIVFIQIGIFFGSGGGYSMISLIQGQVVTQYHWMTMQEFTDVVAISQTIPHRDLSDEHRHLLWLYSCP